MYNFMYSEVWWMETIVSATITTLGTIIVGYIAYKGVLKEKLRDIEELLKTQDTQHKDLNTKHKELSAEHKELSIEHKELQGSIQSVKENLIKIHAFQEKEAAVRQEASKHMPKESQLEALVKDVFENNRMLQNKLDVMQNELLKEKNHNERLEKELEDMKAIVEAQKRKELEHLLDRNRDGNELE